MSNYKPRIESNNLDLTSILSTINVLPNAGTLKPEQTKTVTPSLSQQTIVPDSGYTLSSVTVNAMPTATQATPSISVSSGGLITASATQTAGYVSAGTKSATSQLSTQAAKTITPSTSSQTAVASGKYTTGTVTVAAVPTQTKTVTPSASVQNITPDDGKFLSEVTVNAMPSEDLSAELAEYTALNAELEEVIDSLPDAGSGGGGMETCTLTVEGGSTNYYPTDIAYTTVNDSGDVQYAYNSVSGSSITVTCLRNSIVAVKFKTYFNYTSSTNIPSNLLFYNGPLAIWKIGDVEMITIRNTSTSSGGSG